MNVERFRKEQLNDLSKRTAEDYNFILDKYIPINNGCFKCKCDNKEYFIKHTNIYTLAKYNFLYNQGVDNILYPIRNKSGEMVSKLENDFESAYYITPFIKGYYMIDEVKIRDMASELKKLHKSTSFKKSLDPYKSRKKMEELFTHLNFKFSEIESYVRTIEAREYDEFSIPVLKNYQYILDGKKEMIRLNRKIVLAIKERRSVNFCFLHNNPKLEHLILSNGNKYLISLEKGIIGISSLDMAKFYVENEDVSVDMKSIIEEYFTESDNEFYYDYFSFLVLLIYVETLNINDKDYATSQSFIYTSQGIKKFLHTFTFKKIEKNVV